jgi:hypothetical protein
MVPAGKGMVERWWISEEGEGWMVERRERDAETDC